MKKFWLALIAIISLMLISEGAFGTNQPISNSDVPAQLNDTDRKRGYQFTGAENSIVFIFDELTQNRPSATEVSVRGSFNAWAGSDSWRLTKSAIQGLWVLKKPINEVNIPGNSGQPEFRFVVDGDAWLAPVSDEPGYQFLNNCIIVWPGDDIRRIVERETIANTEKKLADFNLASDHDQHTLANFRRVPGTGKLFRSYHPFKKSYANLDTEAARIGMVTELMKRNAIQSIICLSGDEAPVGDEVISGYQQNIIDDHHQCFFNTTYQTVYYQSNGPEFATLIKKSVEFMIDPYHKAPFLVHCRLGTDRTGMVAAIIAALCGASWDEIRADYEKSNHLGIKEFRDDKLIQYAVEHMLDKKIDNRSDLQTEITKYFIDGGWLTGDQINILRTKLK